MLTSYEHDIVDFSKKFVSFEIQFGKFSVTEPSDILQSKFNVV